MGRRCSGRPRRRRTYPEFRPERYARRGGRQHDVRAWCAPARPAMVDSGGHVSLQPLLAQVEEMMEA